MQMNNFLPSQFWDYNIEKNFNKTVLDDFENFKSNSINFKLAIWNPKTNGIRYLKALLYNMCTTTSLENWQRIKKIQNRNYGNSYSITYNDEEICMDYLQAAYELEFISNNINLNSANILEIGAGYGRTCHTILSNHDVKNYYIVDLEKCLYISQKYLKKVLDNKAFSKIHFLTIKNFESLKDSISFYITINIDSFAEMDINVIKAYLDYIDKHSDYFYVKNPVGKYMDKSLDNHSQGQKVVELAMKTGLLRDIVDIHNNKAINQQVSKFIKVYQPGNNWNCIDNAWSPPWSFYWQAIYKNNFKLQI